MDSQDNQCNSYHQLHQTYGELLTLDDVSKILRFPSGDAVRKAISRGTLDLRIIKIKNRRQVFVKTEAVVKYLRSL